MDSERQVMATTTTTTTSKRKQGGMIRGCFLVARHGDPLLSSGRQGNPGLAEGQLTREVRKERRRFRDDLGLHGPRTEKPDTQEPNPNLEKGTLGNQRSP